MDDNERAIPVLAALRPWVSGISVVTAGRDGGERTVVAVPDHATALALRTAPGQGSELVVMGPRTRALYHAVGPGPFCVMARLRPGRAGLLLGRSVRELVNQAVPLRSLRGEPGARLDGEPAVLATPPVLRMLEEALLSDLTSRQLGDLPGRDLVRDAAALLSVAARWGPERVGSTARRLHVSERNLRNLFTDGVGISPKQFARIDRVRTVLGSAGHRPWAHLATEAGYYDQSHMAAEFRRLMGVTLSAFTAGVFPAASPCGRS